MGMNRREFISGTMRAGAALAFGGHLAFGTESGGGKDKPNVLFIAIDDLNDWVGAMETHPQVRTPNFDRLAKRGVLFSEAQASTPLCNPSRSAVLSGLGAWTTGVYGNWSKLRNSPAYEQEAMMPRFFMKHGYRAWRAGKVLHRHNAELWREGSHDGHGPTGNYGPYPATENGQYPGLGVETKPVGGWGPLRADIDWYYDWRREIPYRYESDEDRDRMVEEVTVDYAIKHLKQKHEHPFFIAAGLYKPHHSRHCPRKYFDMYPLESVVLPEMPPEDRDDLPAGGLKRIKLKNNRKAEDGLARTLPNLKKVGQMKAYVQSYLACISFMDDELGRLIDALDASGQADNTIVVAWSDHGFHNGEKDIIGKNTLWRMSCRSPLAIVAPGVSRPGGECAHPVSLLDIYPTLLELCGLKSNPYADYGRDLDGDSLVPLLRNPKGQWKRPALVAITNHGEHSDPHFAVCQDKWRYLRYGSDGGEELYDIERDPHEFTNLAGQAAYAGIIARLSRYVPADTAPLAPGDTTSSETSRVKKNGKIVKVDAEERVVMMENQKGSFKVSIRDGGKPVLVTRYGTIEQLPGNEVIQAYGSVSQDGKTLDAVKLRSVPWNLSEKSGAHIISGLLSREGGKVRLKVSDREFVVREGDDFKVEIVERAAIDKLPVDREATAFGKADGRNLSEGYVIAEPEGK